jgi:hypothetical protein
MSLLTNKDYTDILTYYKLPIPKSSRLLQKEAEKIMATKLCKCIKKLDPKNEARSIGICTNTIFKRKGYSRGEFKCTNKRYVKFGKTRTGSKTRKNKN